MSEYIDVSVPLNEQLPVWPGSPRVKVVRTKNISQGDACNVSMFSSEVHAGTHVDAPLHFVVDGSPVNRLPLEVLIGPANVVTIPKSGAIERSDLVAQRPAKLESRLLLRTSNSRLWADPKFQESYAGLTVNGAEWVVEQEIRLIGIDYLSIQSFREDDRVHKILCEANVVILEGLNLSEIPSGRYELICLPILLENAEAAPCRAVLRPVELA